MFFLLVLGALHRFAFAEEAVLLVSVSDSEIDTRSLVAHAAGDLLSQGYRLIAESEALEAVNDDLEEEPSAEELERWAEILEADLIVVVFLASPQENGVHARIHIHLASLHQTSVIERETTTDELGNTVESLVREVLAQAQNDALSHGDVQTSDADGEDAAERPPPPLEQPELPHEGRAQLILDGTLLGLSIMTGILLAADVRDPRLFAPMLLLGGGAGLMTSLLIYRRWRVSRGDNAVAAAGGWYGAGTGLLLTGLIGFDHYRSLSLGGLIGQVAGLTVGIIAAAYTEISAGAGALLHSGALWGLVLGAATSTLVWHDDQRTSYGLILAGLLTGIAAGGLLSHFVEVTPGRTAIIDLCGMLTVLLGAAVGAPIIIESQSAGHFRAYAGILLGAAAAGIGLGVLVTRAWERNRERRQGRRRRREGHGSVSFAPIPTIIPPAPTTPRAGVGLGVQLVGGTW